MVDRPLDESLFTASERATQFVSEIIMLIEAFERQNHTRTRTRKPVDQDRFERSIAILISNLACNHFASPADWLYLSLSHRNLLPPQRYRSFNFGSGLSALLKVMGSNELGLLEFRMGRRERVDDGVRVIVVRRQSTIRAAQGLLDPMSEIGLTVNDFGPSGNEEVIVLKTTNEGPHERGVWLDYQDNEQTNNWRRHLREYNRWIGGCRIEYLGEERVNVNSRRLRRYFNNSRFDHGGRFFDGFWINLAKLDRLQNIRINGEVVAELDFGQIVPRLLYSRRRLRPPEGDLYDVPGVPIDLDRQRRREGIKKILNSALFANRQQNQFPKYSRTFFPNRRVSYHQVLDPILQYHHGIADQLFRGIGMELMFIESEIMSRVMDSARLLNVPVLPVHDAVLVPASQQDRIRTIMEDAHREIGQVEAVIRATSGHD